jgi:ubiquinone/menaquinone biosynthesis C-methylase UbiE
LRREAVMTSLGTKSLAQQKFGAAAADYATSTVHARGESLDRLVELVAPEKRWRVLDVAAGAGHTALALAPHVAKVTASDITEAMLAEAKKLAAARGFGNVKTVHAKAEDLPFPDMSFDLVTCRLAAHHFSDVAAFGAEAYRVLMPNGLLAVVDNISPDQEIFPALSAEDARHWTKAYDAFEKLRDPSHGHCLSLTAWRDVLGKAGFDVVAAEHMDQDLEFGPWVTRMRCDEATVARLRALLQDEPLRDLLKPRETETDTMFTLQEGIIVARKPTTPSSR